MRRDPSSGRFGDRYRIVRALGRGGFATVYEAWDEVARRPVALKLVDRRALDLAGGLHRFHREATVLQHLSHPSIVRAYAAGEHEGTPYLVLELLEGLTVEAALRAGPMALPRVVSIARGLLGALAEAHRAGVVHRDVKPANVFLCSVAGAEVVKLLDFGVAKADGLDVAQTAMGATLGTAAYMAPEQVTGATPVGPQADLFAVGLLIAEALAGAPVYRGGSGLSILVAKAGGRPVELPPGVLASPVGAVVARAVAIDPAQRWESADAMRAALDAAVAHRVVDPAAIAPAADPLGATAPLATLRSAIDAARAGVPPSGVDATWRPPQVARQEIEERVELVSVVPVSGGDEEPVEPAAETVASPDLRRRRLVAAAAALAAAALVVVGVRAAVDVYRGERDAKERRIVVKQDGAVIVTDGPFTMRAIASPGLPLHPVLACPALAQLPVEEVGRRLTELGAVTPQHRGELVAMWLVGRPAPAVHGVTLFRVEAARMKLSRDQAVAAIVERVRVQGTVLVGGTHVLVGAAGIPAETLKAAVCR